MALFGRCGWMLPILLLALSACSSGRPPPPSATSDAPTQVAALPGSSTAATPIKVGRPYQINDVWYYPREQPGYSESGIASWYGRRFHGRLTANGETFDMNALTAAHPTLPLPSMVRVTNLENGRSLVLRVNDRGPFAKGRLIDISRRGAQLLGFIDKGTARVQVTLLDAGGDVVPPVVTTAEERDALPALPQVPVASRTLPPPAGMEASPPIATEASPPARRAGTKLASLEQASLAAATSPEPTVSYVPVRPTSIYVQAGAFIDYNRAVRLGDSLHTIGPVRITRTSVDGQRLFRVRLGPWQEVDDADLALRQVIDSGIGDARIIVD